MTLRGSFSLLEVTATAWMEMKKNKIKKKKKRLKSNVEPEDITELL